MNRLIIAGSPRLNGRTGSLAHDLFEACIEECPEDELAWVPISEVLVQGCQGCGYCQSWAKDLLERFDEISQAAEDEELEIPARCSLDDDMTDIYEHIDLADELTIVSPVYFAGPPSQLKALLDRMQPYFCLNIVEGAGEGVPKRPAILHVVGEGGDPHGFDALVTIVKSAVAVAGFQLETVFDWVGKINEEGEILEEATVINLVDSPEDEDFLEESQEEPVVKPTLHLDDKQVQEVGRRSAEMGRRPDKSGKTEKRQGKGNSQTNNRNKRKENQNRRPSDGKNTGPKNPQGRKQQPGGKRSGSKGGNNRG